MYVTAAVQLLMVVNASVNLPIYFFAGKSFRAVSLELIRCVYCRKIETHMDGSSGPAVGHGHTNQGHERHGDTVNRHEKTGYTIQGHERPGDTVLGQKRQDDTVLGQAHERHGDVGQEHVEILNGQEKHGYTSQTQKMPLGGNIYTDNSEHGTGLAVTML